MPKIKILDSNVNEYGKIIEKLAPDDGLIINEEVSATTDVFDFAIQGYDHNTVVCNGLLASPYGVQAFNNSNVAIGALGYIIADGTAIVASDGNVINHGQVYGNDTILGGGKFNLTNSGNIFAKDAAIIVTGQAHIVNSGKIESFTHHAMETDDLSDNVMNTGSIIGNVMLKDGNDKFDTLKGRVTGSIDAGAGADKLIGGLYKDIMTGGSGNDTFYFKTTPEKSSVDVITDFSHGHDKIVLGASWLDLDPGEKLSSTFHDVTSGLKTEQFDDHILYNRNTGALYYDADGKGGHSPVKFAVLDGHPALSFHDFLIG